MLLLRGPCLCLANNLWISSCCVLNLTYSTCNIHGLSLQPFMFEAWHARLLGTRAFRAITHHAMHSQEMFCKQKGYLEEELDYRKQALDQAYMVHPCTQHPPPSVWTTTLLSWGFLNKLVGYTATQLLMKNTCGLRGLCIRKQKNKSHCKGF